MTMPVAAFGGWEFYDSSLTLRRTGNAKTGGGYEIDLETCTTSAEMLDWIFQIRNKTWGGDAVADLVWAFEVLLHPQASLCSGGCEQGPINPADEIRGGGW